DHRAVAQLRRGRAMPRVSRRVAEREDPSGAPVGSRGRLQSGVGLRCVPQAAAISTAPDGDLRGQRRDGDRRALGARGGRGTGAGRDGGRRVRRHSNGALHAPTPVYRPRGHQCAGRAGGAPAARCCGERAQASQPARDVAGDVGHPGILRRARRAGRFFTSSSGGKIMRGQTLLCRLGLVVASVVAFAGLPAAGAAQTSTGSVRGYVTDSAGNALEGARVVAVSVLSSTQREVATQGKGYYALLGLVPGEYDVTARQIGMAPQKIRARVLVGGVYPLDFKLGATAIQLEAVTVAVANGVETRTSEVATNVTQQQITQLPTVSRNFLDLAALAPGVTASEDRVNGV